ncbi:MAG: T9SS type A sorting domain-containing protein [Gemmatimonadetes bacterium]|nr:T9SS type A sorting domain-containing protein [Gemmatimonadota bacterium]
MRTALLLSIGASLGITAPTLAASRVDLPFDHAMVEVMSIAPSQSGRVYLGTRGLGVWRTDDSGVHWIDCSVGLPVDATVRSLLVSDTDSARLLAGTMGGSGSSGSLFLSTDAGTSWNETSTGFDGSSVEAIVSDPSSPSTLYAGLAGGALPGLYRSIDSGLTWTWVGATLPQDVHAVSISPVDPDVWLVGLSGASARTTDAGATWSVGGMIYDVRELARSPAAPNVVYASLRDPLGVAGFVRRSTDDGTTFAAVASLGYVQATSAVAPDPVEPDALLWGGAGGYFSSRTEQVVKSTDGGSTYDVLLADGPDSRGTTGYVTGIEHDPVDPAVLYVSETFVDGRGLRFSSDGGSTWSLRIDGVPNYGVDEIVEGTTGTVYAAASGRTFRSPATGQWTDQDYYGVGFEYLDEFKGMAVSVDETGSDNALFRWGYWTEGDIDGEYFIASVDGAQTWFLGFPPMPSGLDDRLEIHDVAFDHLTGSRCYVSQPGAGLFRQDDGGLPFSPFMLLDSTLDRAQIAVHPADPSTVFAANGPTTCVRSTDGGATFAPRNTGLPAAGGGLSIVELFIDPSDGDHLSCVYSDGRVYDTTDGGVGWSLRHAIDLASGAIEDASWDPATGHVFLATSGAGLVSSWPAVSPVPTLETRSVHYSVSRQTLFVGTAYSGLWEQALTLGTAAPVVDEQARLTLLVRPNPFANATSISLTVPAGGGDVHVTVFDAAGRRVRELTRGRHEAGPLELSWSGRDQAGRSVPSGVYFVRADVAGAVTSTKIALRR